MSENLDPLVKRFIENHNYSKDSKPCDNAIHQISKNYENLNELDLIIIETVLQLQYERKITDNYIFLDLTELCELVFTSQTNLALSLVFSSLKKLSSLTLYVQKDSDKNVCLIPAPTKKEESFLASIEDNKILTEHNLFYKKEYTSEERCIDVNSYFATETLNNLLNLTKGINEE